MSRSIFGWDLPPGVTQRMIDEAYGPDEPPWCAECAEENCDPEKCEINIAEMEKWEEQCKAEEEGMAKMY